MKNKLKYISLIIVLLLSAKANAQVIINKSYFGKTQTQIIKDLAKSYYLDIDYNPKDLKKGIAPSITFKDMPLDKAMDKLLNGSGLNYEIYEKLVIIRKNGTEIVLEKKVYKRKTNFNISGVVKDISTGEALPYSQILVRGTTNGTTSNVDGYFTLFKVPTDTSILEVTYLGYDKKNIFLTPEMVSASLTVELASRATQLGEVVIRAERGDLLKVSEQISMVSITPKEIAMLPCLGEKDIFRAFQLLPGISGSNESSAGLYVRGGTPDQNLILYDGFSVYHQEHLFGMYSAFNSNAIKDVQLYKGGFESKYGGRLSSVMEIIGKTGNEKEFNMGGDISFLSFNAFAEIPLNNKGSIFIAGRKSFKGILYDKFFDAYSEDNSEGSAASSAMPSKGNRSMSSSEPSSYFYDLNAKATFRPTDKDVVSLSFFNGQDDLDNSREINRSRGGVSVSGGVTDLTKWGNWGSSLKWSRKLNDKLYTNNLLSYSNYYSVRDRSTSRTITRDGEASLMEQGTLEDNNLKDLSFKTDNEYKTGKNNQIEFGAHLTNYNIDYEYSQNDTISILDMHDKGNLASFYLQDKWTPFGKVTFVPGLRASYYDVTGKMYYEPRASLSYDLTDRFKLKSAWGKYYQFANRVIREDIFAGSRDFWVLSNGSDIPVGESMHYILGGSYETGKFLFDVEAYYKDLSGLSEYTMRFAPSYGSINYNSLFYEGQGYAQGIEFLMQKKHGNYTGWMGYTLGEVNYNFPIYGEGYFPASHDVTHEFKVVNSYKWKRWVFSGTWIYATGKPYTEPIGGYSLSMEDGTTADFITVGQKNDARYPAYHRLDLSAKLEFKLGDRSMGDIGFSLFNVYNNTNIWYKEFEIDETGLSENDVNLLGITPNITLSIRLK